MVGNSQVNLLACSDFVMQLLTWDGLYNRIHGARVKGHE